MLGTVERDMDAGFWVCGWVSAEKGALCEVDRFYSWAAVHYQAFDVTQPGSLERLFYGWDNAFYDADNAQFVQLYSEDYSTSISGARSGEHRPCTLRIYDAEGMHEFELDYECRTCSSNQASLTSFQRSRYSIGRTTCSTSSP